MIAQGTAVVTLKVSSTEVNKLETECRRSGYSCQVYHCADRAGMHTVEITRPVYFVDGSLRLQ